MGSARLLPTLCPLHPVAFPQSDAPAETLQMRLGDPAAHCNSRPVPARAAGLWACHFIAGPWFPQMQNVGKKVPTSQCCNAVSVSK